MEEGKKYNNKLNWPDFLNYLTRTFTNHEMHHFERKVDKSAFDTEALDGLEQFAGASMNNDIELLKDHIHKRNTLFQPKKQSRFTLKNVAAIAIIVVISGILLTLLISRSGKMDEQLAQNTTLTTPDSVEKVQMLAQQSTPTQQIEQEQTTVNKETIHPKNKVKSKDVLAQPSDNKTVKITEPVVTDDFEVEQNSEIQSEFDMATQQIEHADPSKNEDSTPLVSEEFLIQPTAQKTALLTVNTQVKNQAVEADTPLTLSIANTEVQEIHYLQKIHPKIGDNELATQLKQWLHKQNLKNAGEIKIKLTFGEDLILKKVSIIYGIDVDTDKAIQYYILKNTEWVSDSQNIVFGLEYEYSLSL